MYRNLNSTTVRHLGLRTNTAFRHVNQYHQRPAVSAIRLVIVRPSVAGQRGLHLSRDLLRSETKLGKVAVEEKETMTSRAAALAKEQQAAKAAALASSGTVSATNAATAIKPKKTLWQKVKAEAVHYWHGTQLLGLEVKISSSLTWKLLHGGKLTRREQRQVKKKKFPHLTLSIIYILTHNFFFFIVTSYYI